MRQRDSEFDHSQPGASTASMKSPHYWGSDTGVTMATVNKRKVFSVLEQDILMYS